LATAAAVTFSMLLQCKCAYVLDVRASNYNINIGWDWAPWYCSLKWVSCTIPWWWGWSYM